MSVIVLIEFSVHENAATNMEHKTLFKCNKIYVAHNVFHEKNNSQPLNLYTTTTASHMVLIQIFPKIG